MSHNLLQAYRTGKALALYKFAEQNNIGTEEDLTPVLEYISSGAPIQAIKADVKNDSEKAEKASWGDKIELEPGSATGVEV